MTRLLLLSCSARKRATNVALPAGQLYIGVFYSVIAKARCEQRWAADITVAIVSAEHGFLRENDLLFPYDRRMNGSRACELRPVVCERLDALLLHLCPSQILVAMGLSYRLCLTDSKELAVLDAVGQVTWAQGGLGKQLQIVHDWIGREPV
jgi:hypothetical protein